MPNSTFWVIENMRPHDYTDMGGTSEAFLTTHWSLIEDIKSKKDKDKALMNLLLKRYWKPVYCYLRHKGYDNEQAKDLTQDFFYEVVLNRDLVQRAEQCKGRFRSFLLHALNQYLIDQKREERSHKRIPKDKLVSLDITETPVVPKTISKLGPEESFNYAWKSTFLDRILSQVQTQCYEQDMEVHWKVFNDRVVQPILENLEAPSLQEICAKYSIEDEVKASNMAITVKRRFRSALKKYIRSTVISESQTDEELKEILKLFPKKAQDSR
jgi:DNA-directed RNA polymerase specialized sigma24 family protein